ncbi:MAG: hypothetical protein B6D37_01005 [Sphingobacteriales bacterium UTBCD1]|jgi:hypothetical protein|nr:MAG: hypothetical protein B6D37_01005 [Sphingobacteriales bacterium UTBCD1]
MKKISLLLFSVFFVTGLMAQQKDIYGNFIKSDGTKIKGTSVAIGYEGQIIISNYTGGSDNSGIIEIEVPSGAYVADFRNLMNTQNTVNANKQVPGKSINATVRPNTINAGINKNQLVQQPVTLMAIDIAVTTPFKDQKSHAINSKIILQDISVQSVTDNVSTGSSKIKLKATRIGWIYYTYEQTSRKLSGSSKSGWDNAAGKAWTDF